MHIILLDLLAPTFLKKIIFQYGYDGKRGIIVHNQWSAKCMCARSKSSIVIAFPGFCDIEFEILDFNFYCNAVAFGNSNDFMREV